MKLERRDNTIEKVLRFFLCGRSSNIVVLAAAAAAAASAAAGLIFIIVKATTYGGANVCVCVCGAYNLRAHWISPWH